MQYRQQRTRRGPQVKRQHVFTPADDQELASPQYAGHHAGLHSEGAPSTTAADGRPRQTYRYGPDEHEAGFIISSITKRYNGIPMPDGVLYRQGTDQVYVHRRPPPVPQRASRGRETEEHQLLPRARLPRKRLHWLFFVGIGLIIMLAE